MGRRTVRPIGVLSRYLEGIPDIFIPPTQIDNAGVMRERNENSGMTIRGRQDNGDSFTPSPAAAQSIGNWRWP